MNKIKDIIYIIGFLFIIFIMGILFIIMPQKKVSFIENRNLAEKPSPSMQSLISGELFSKFDTYLSDQIPGRDTLVKYYTEINLYVLGKKKVNNVVIGKDGYLLGFKPFKEFNAEEQNKEKIDITNMVSNLSELNKYIESYGGKFYFIGIPHQKSYNRDKFPKYFYNGADRLNFRRKLMFSELNKKNICNIDIYKTFKNSKEEDIYFKTDHHYNFKGAYLVYQAVMSEISSLGDIKISNILEKNDFIVKTLDNPFVGSLNKQLYELYSTNEKLEIGYVKNEISFQKYDNGSEDNRLYYTPKDNKTSINYGVYMGGDNEETVIKTNRDKLDNVLIFGDSYTNAVEPLIAQNFNETRILDLRYYKQKSLYEYINEYKPRVVIMMRDDESFGIQSGNGNFKYSK